MTIQQPKTKSRITFLWRCKSRKIIGSVAVGLVAGFSASAVADFEDELRKLIPKAEELGIEVPDELKQLTCEGPPQQVPVCSKKLIVGTGANASIKSTSALNISQNTFPSIAEALRAHNDSSCAANIVLAKESHAEHVTIDRSASLSSPSGMIAKLNGSITMNGPHSLKVYRLALAGTRPTKQNRGGSENGGIDVSSPCAAVSVTATTIEDMKGFGYRQKGGSLTMDFVTVEGTRRATSGTGTAAVELSEGVIAKLTGVKLDRNAARGMYVRGPSTEVTGTSVEIDNTFINDNWFNQCAAESEYFTGLAALEVADRADVTLSGSMSNNGFAGLYAHSGASANWLKGKITHTKSFASPDCVYGISPTPRTQNLGGIGAYSRTDSDISLKNFELSYSDLCGFIVGPEGDINAANGEVSYNTIGACVQREGFDVSKISDGVYYLNNTRNIDAATLPIPDTGSPF